MAHDREISPSIPIFKNEERTLYTHTSHDLPLQYCQQMGMTPNFLNSPALVGNKDISGKFKSQNWLQL